MRFLVSLLLLLSAAAGAAAEPGAQIRANLVALHQAKHPWAAAAIATADRKDAVYADFGQHATIAYAMTGQAKYRDAAVPKLLKALTIDPLPAANNVREYFAELAMLYGWLRPDLTDEQNAEFEKRFHRWCEFCCDVDMPKPYVGGWGLYTDSDRTTGQYLGLLLCDQIFGWKWTERPDAITARAAIDSYVAKSAGGEWIESGAYNLGTLQFLLMGTYAAGIEQFPEVEKLVPDLVERQLDILTPDFKQAYQWGDEENPRELHVHRRLALFGMLIGLSGDARLQTALDEVLAGKSYKDYAHLAWRALYLYQPPRKASAGKYLKISEGNGHFLYKRDEALLGVHFPKRLGVQHEVSYTADLQWYVDGEWVVTRPIGYGLLPGSGEAGNSPLFGGLSSMQIRGPTEWQETADGFQITGGTSGPFPYESNYRNPPGPFVQHAREITYQHPGKLIVVDKFKGNKPPDVAKYRATEQALINAAPLWQVVWHGPLDLTPIKNGYSWKTAKGKTVSLTVTAPKDYRIVLVDEREKWGKATTNFKASELKRQIRFVSDEPECEITSVLGVK